MSQLVAFYEEKPAGLKGKVDLHQEAIDRATDARSSDGVVRADVVYVKRHTEAGPFLVPFGEYDDWSLSDRYNEAIRIMNTLGAASITCESFREITKRRGIVARIRNQGPDVSQQRVENSGFDFHHQGAGSAARDPRPLRWPDEPGFAAAVSSVLDNGATEVVINIRNSRSHSVNGELALTLKALGFQLGGNGHEAAATRLHIRAAFPGTKKQWW